MKNEALIALILSSNIDDCTSVKERIFTPLGMKDTFFYVPKDKVDRLATAYTCTKAKDWPGFQTAQPRKDRFPIRLIILLSVPKSFSPAVVASVPRCQTMLACVNSC